MLTGADRTYTWNSENKPLTINNSATGAEATFSYGPGGEILTENLYGRTVSQVVTHIGGIYDIVEKVDTVTRASGEILQRAYVAGVCVVTQSASAADAKIDKNKKVWKRYMHGDHLGSVEAITDERGNVLQRYDYDVWGAQRNTQSVSDNGPVPITERGFTGHEELADLGLVHMIGRVYDPLIGRFCSADPTVQFPSNSQSYNRYSYVLNNPLSLTDPTGFFSVGSLWNGITGAASSIAHAVANIGKSVGKWVAQNWRTIAVTSITIVASVVTMGVATPVIGAFGAVVISGAVGGAINGGLTTVLYGGSVSQMWKSMLSGAKAGALGMYAPLVSGDYKGFAIGIGSAFLGGMVGINGTTVTAMMSRAVVSAAIGGTASELSGGKFANGAVTMAFASLLNSTIQNPQLLPRLFLGAMDVVGKIWNLPNTVIGSVWGGIGWMASHTFGDGTATVSFQHNAIQFINHPFAGTAETIGNTISYDSDYNPEEFSRPEGHTYWQHEIQHTFQGQLLGPLYLPAISLSYGLSYVVDGPSAYFHGPTSFMERGPQTYGANNRMFNFSKDYVSPY